MRPRALGPTVIALLLLMSLLTACGTDTPQAQVSSPPSPAPSYSPPPPAPAVGSCHDLTYQQATAATQTSDPIPCSKPHTSRTFATGSLNQLRDGHLLAVDSKAAQRNLTATCTGRMARFLGAGAAELQVTQFKAIWFTPTFAQADEGSSWFRCDLVALKRDGELMMLPSAPKGILGRGYGSSYATCGAGTPGSPDFKKVACAVAHQWRAAKAIEFPAKAQYSNPEQTQSADASCKDIAAGAAGNNLKFRWVFTWPTKEQWHSGVRAGICWLPA